jgi:hypothetical protein
MCLYYVATNDQWKRLAHHSTLRTGANRDSAFASDALNRRSRRPGRDAL